MLEIFGTCRSSRGSYTSAVATAAIMLPHLTQGQLMFLAMIPLKALVRFIQSTKSRLISSESSTKFYTFPDMIQRIPGILAITTS